MPLYKYNKDNIIDFFKEKHGEKFDYSKVMYIDLQTHVTIKCKKHNHTFTQSPRKHLEGKGGCIKCASELRNISIKKTEEQFLKEAKAKFGDKLIYHNYVDQTTKMQITCPEHGDFYILPRYHIFNQYGCPKCAIAAQSRQMKKTFTDFITQATKAHGDKFTYNEDSFVDYDNKIEITCPIHGVFKQKPKYHVTGKGCPECGKHSFKDSKPGIMYYLSINNGQAYKIGITNKTIQERFYLPDLEQISVLKTWEYSDGAECRKAERKILQNYKQYKYTGPNLLSSGNSELFTIDVLGLDLKDTT